MNLELVTIAPGSKKYILTERGLSFLKEELFKGKSYAQLATIFDVNQDTLSSISKTYNLHVDNRRKYTVNHYYFENIDTAEKAYWLGFLDADGNIDKKKQHLSITLQRKDENALYKFRQCLDSSHPVNHKMCIFNNQSYAQSVLTISSRILCEDLVKAGCVPNKSLCLLPPQIDNSLIPYWVLGYMDGDGSVKTYIDKTNQKPRLNISFTGTYEVLSFIRDYFGTNSKIQKEHRCENTFHFTVTETKSIEFLSCLYNSSPIDYISLDRKREKFIQYIQLRKECINGRS